MDHYSQFHFKRFSVSQSQSAMKVGTDGVLLGSWINLGGATTAIDVGAGTGLIALMLAQRGIGRVTAIEIDHQAAQECAMNAAQSPWPGAISTWRGDFLAYDGPTVDLIVSNPPFFTESLQSPDAKRAAARSADSLPLKSLLRKAHELLNPNGRIALILPIGREEELKFEATMEHLTPLRTTLVRDNPRRPYKRMLVEIGSTPVSATAHVNDTLTIRGYPGPNQGYTPEFEELTRDFYL